MAHRQHTDPLPAHVTAVLRDEIQRRLAQLAKQLKHSLELAVVLVKDDHIVGTAPGLRADGRDKTAQRGDLRLTFIEVFDPASRLFEAMARFEPDARSPGFEGFSVRGHVWSHEDGSVSTRAPTWVVNWRG
jgi:hypothetical protein